MSARSPSSVATPSLVLDRIEVVLCQTSMAENIGAAARAMKTMGLSRLVLVAPRAAVDDKARSVATHAAALLDGARRVETIEQAVADSVAVWATTARSRHLNLAVVDGRTAAGEIVSQARAVPEGSPGRVSILFGAERTGLTNAELGAADRLLALDANPDYPVLNLAQAVQLVAYEVFHAAGVSPGGPLATDLPATKAELATLCARLEAALGGRAFFPGAAGEERERNARRLMQRVRLLLNRAQPSTDELQILHGMLTALLRVPRDRDE